MVIHVRLPPIMLALGYSINLITLFGLILAIGIVVDDAIVVVEAVSTKMEGGLSAADATVAQVVGADAVGRKWRARAVAAGAAGPGPEHSSRATSSRARRISGRSPT